MSVPLAVPIQLDLVIVRLVIVPVEKERVEKIPRWRINRAKFLLYANGVKAGKSLIEALQIIQEQYGDIRIACLDCFIPEENPVCDPLRRILSGNGEHHGLYRFRFGDPSGIATAISHLVDIAESNEIMRIKRIRKQAFSRIFVNTVVALSEVHLP